jgi:hypothetical protein
MDSNTGLWRWKGRGRKWFCYGQRLGRARKSGWLGGLSLAQEAARYPQRAFGLLHMNGLGQNQIRAEAKRFGHAGLSFNYGHRQ